MMNRDHSLDIRWRRFLATWVKGYVGFRRRSSLPVAHLRLVVTADSQEGSSSPLENVSLHRVLLSEFDVLSRWWIPSRSALSSSGVLSPLARLLLSLRSPLTFDRNRKSRHRTSITSNATRFVNPSSRVLRRILLSFLLKPEPFGSTIPSISASLSFLIHGDFHKK